MRDYEEDKKIGDLEKALRSGRVDKMCNKIQKALIAYGFTKGESLELLNKFLPLATEVMGSRNGKIQQVSRCQS